MTMRSRLGAVLVSAACGVPACVLAADTAVRTFGTNGTTRVLLHPSNNTGGEKNVVFWYEGKDGVVVDGEGATFVFRGNVFPFAARKCRNLTFRNFTVTTEFPSCAGFRVESADEKGFTVRFDEGTCPYRVDGDALVFDLPGLPVSTRCGRISLHALDRIAIHYLMTPSSPGDKDEFPSTFVGVVPKDLGDRRVRFDYYGDRHAKAIPCPYRVGERVVFNLEEKRLRDVFFLEDCENVKIENVTVRRFGGMGVVAQRSGDITIDRFVAEPSPGEGVTLTADVFQFINCHGQVRIENSSCGNSLDDVLNVHGNYLVVERIDGRRVSLRAKHVQHCGFFPYRPGDALEFVVERSREVIASAKVISVAPHPTDRYVVTLTLASEVSVPPGTLVENVTLNPDVTLRNNRFHDFPHARLSGRGKFLIEQNRFERCQTAIFACDLAEYWYESGRIGEMTIRDNDFVDANALGGDAAIAFGVSGWGDDAPKVHGRVVLADNRYERSDGCASFPGVREAVVNPWARGNLVPAIASEFEVDLDGKPLVVQPARVSARPINQVWAGYQRPVSQTEMSAFVSFDLAAPGELGIRPSASGNLGEPVVLPLSFKPAIRHEGGLWKISVDRPRQFAVSFGKDAPVLHVFANPPFVAPQGGKVRRFGPGEHDVGLIRVGSGETVVIEEGAVVYGAVQVLHATNAKVVGRGIVDASRLNRADHASAAYAAALEAGLSPGFYGAEMAVTAFTAVGSTNVLVEGVTFRDPPRWTMILRSQCKGVTIDNVKIVGCWRYNADGINVCSSEDVAIRNCFVRSFDDCIIARGPYLDGCTGPTRNVLAENCVLWCDWGKNLEVWAGHRPCLIENVTYRNIACVYPGQIACDVTTWFASPDTTIRNVTMEDIELDYARTRWTYHYQQGPDDAVYRGNPDGSSMLIQVDVARYGRYLGNQKHVPAKDLSGFRVAYSNLTFRNFRCLGDVPKLHAVVDAMTAPHTVEGVRFENLPLEPVVRQRGSNVIPTVR